MATIFGTFGDDNIVGNADDDDIFGLTGDDDLRGGGGEDNIFGGFGDDDIRGQAGSDELDGGFGDDIIRGGGGSDTIFGGFGDDDLRGNGGSDELNGGAGDDRLDGGANDDTYIGGGGDDIFAFSYDGDSTNVQEDEVEDFSESNGFFGLFSNDDELEFSFSNTEGDVYAVRDGDTLRIVDSGLDNNIRTDADNQLLGIIEFASESVVDDLDASDLSSASDDIIFVG